MSKFHYITIRSIAILILLVVIFPAAILSRPDTAQACSGAGMAKTKATQITSAVTSGQVVPVYDRANLTQNSTVAGNTSELVTKECITDLILNILAKQLIKAITQSIVQWIQSGFQGAPTFVQDPQGFLLYNADQAAGKWLASSEFNFLCQPFQNQLKLSIQIQYGGSFQDKASCTISGVINGFMTGSFAANGGWDTWFEVTQNRQNNPIGAKIIADDAFLTKIANSLGEEKAKLDWGQGFHSIVDGANKILTPGKTIEAQLSHTLGSDLRQLELADEINEIIGALVGQLVNVMMNELGGGLAGGGTQFDYSSAPSLVSNPGTAGICPGDPDCPTDPSDGFDPIPPDLGTGGGGGGTPIVSGSNPPPPDPINVAASANGGTCKQSSTPNVDRGCEKAINGTIDTNNDQARTDNNALYPWWQADIQNTGQPINSIKIYRATNDNYNWALGEFRIFVTDNENLFSSITNPNNLPPAGVTAYPATGSYTFANGINPTDNRIIEINLPGAAGRYVRIQRVKISTEHLALREVQLWTPQAPYLSVFGPLTIVIPQGAFLPDPGAKALNPVTGAIFDADPIPPIPPFNTTSTGPQTLTYTANANGLTTSATRGVNVVPLPEVDLMVCSGTNCSPIQGPLTITSGAGATLSWQAANANTCVGSQGSGVTGWASSKASGSGTFPASGLTSSKVFTITCTNPTIGISVSDTIYVNVDLAPQVVLRANGASQTVPDNLYVPVGTSITVDWSSNTNCTASGDWSGTFLAGTGVTAPITITTDKKYTLTCGSGTTAVATVNVYARLSVGSCAPYDNSGNPITTANLGSTIVTWRATPAVGGDGTNYTYTWGGNNIPTSPAPTGNPYSKVYQLSDGAGAKSAYLKVTSGTQLIQYIMCTGYVAAT